MPYKALILDVDGTLIGDDRTISKGVKKAIAKVRDRVFVSLCSGRVYGSIRKYVEELNLTSFQICDGGGEIYSPAAQKPIYQKIIKTKIAWQIISDLKKNNIHFLASCLSKYHLDKAYTAPEMIEKYKFFIPELPDLNKVKDPQFTKITVLGVNSRNSKKIEKMLRPYSESVHYIISAHHITQSTGLHALDITEKSATKLTALEAYVKLTGINLSETIVVGDGYNDFPLLMAGGLKIAMGNAVPDLKKIADFVAPSVDEDGVAMVIEKFLLS
ncbi:HAD family phosphatase [Candidatus Gottesmanbacteria bacterium]|nr:HAD family phosphatase [Candidatus Gottesmanbacteria bacterium]